MNIIEINKYGLKFIQHTLNILGTVKYYSMERFRYENVLKINRMLKNSCKTDTCLIIGNGPSMKEVDLSRISGKDVITVNKSINTQVFELLNPRYHVVIDKFILNDLVDDLENQLKRSDSETIFILHRSAIDRLGKYPRARFVYSTKMAASCKCINIDMTTNMTTYLNVLPFAVTCAIYMGYKRIAMLGNDFSFFTARKDQHFYDIEENKKRTESLYSDLAGCSIVLLEYRHLYEYAKSKNITLVNATEKTLLDEIPMVMLDHFLEYTEVIKA